MIPPFIREFLIKALEEDMPYGDITTEACVPEGHFSRARAIAKEHLVVCGLAVAREVFKLLDPSVEFNPLKKDGDEVDEGDVLFFVEGPTRAILSGERVALNLLQRLSGIATLARAFVKAIEGTMAKLLDTRKTTPTLRYLEKYAVRTGGGLNHRFSLSDAILIKDNHIKAAGGIKEAIKRAKTVAGPTKIIEVEVENIVQLKDALEEGVHMVMLDNMDLEDIKKAVQICRQRGDIKIEVSGGITIDNVRQVAETGVDYISSGAITHSAKAVDISLEID
ncbi:MAG: carboxylating nicotinate-nucleotide diphosphorylase [Nitrospirae bacterium]|nr:MAG: carboxylating nicotinate-nucleotide diphosphorylase [Nitrospirota bacterium]